MTPPEVPYSASELPWLLIIHHLLLCPRTGLTIPAVLASVSLIVTSTPQLPHPPARLLSP
jgi:hypothetical protein